MNGLITKIPKENRHFSASAQGRSLRKKYLGQYFLANKRIAERIVEAAHINKDDTILEVGPGRGVLTDLLVKKAGQVIAIEKDKELADFLSDKYKGQKNITIVHDDVLKFPFDFAQDKQNYKVVANIPYYITSRFLRQFLTTESQPELMILMLQKEVAERIIAKDGKESLLSISVKVYGQPRIIAKVAAKNFSPAPKVDSAVFAIENISRNFFNPPAGGNKTEEKRFFQILKFGFSHKRKLLKNNILSMRKDRPSVEKILQRCKVPPLARPEELSLENWKCLYNGFK